ncbi:tyrosine-protein phosphatase [Lactobacillus sp. DCY120]|uniref:Tyrosine-protein phosphatase n=1 Tax=Bombilactobacillus apium TaxID=2675299 RepID=A0A850QZK0_9LACO|nr:tyrosine-protein phosphatase [Bombilactobacillus apium]NVY96209.1 tyrosine-protein phosphatase [Bombilactobacillus apium]
MPAEQFLAIPGALNLRDLGGYSTTTGQRIKAQKLLRSGSLVDLKQTAAEQLADKYGVQTIIDFRSASEIERYPDTIPTEARYYNLSVLPFSDHASWLEKVKRRFQAPEDPMLIMYRRMLLDSHANDTYRRFLEFLLMNEDPEQALLFHCTAGKDRTGIAAMIVEGLLGVPEETIYADYLLTNKAMEWISQTSSGSQLVNQMNGQKAEPAYYQAAHNVIQKEFGTWANYAQKQLDFTSGDLSDLKKIYLTDK